MLHLDVNVSWVFFNLWQLLDISLSFTTLAFLMSIGQLFCRLFLNFKVLWCFLMIRFRLCIFNRNDTEVISSQCITLGGTLCQFSSLPALTLINWMRFVRFFSHWKVSILSLCNCVNILFLYKLWLTIFGIHLRFFA